MIDSTQHRRIAARRAITAIATAAAAAMALAGCAGDTEASGDADSDSLTKVTLAMDYVPGMMHNGLALALQEGYFEEHGIELELLPFGGTVADALVGAGTADIGISPGYSGAVIDGATGTPITAIYNISPMAPFAVGALTSSGIETPSDLAGRIYGGFGSLQETAIIGQMIEEDGGSGTIGELVSLTTGGPEALKAGQIDFTFLYTQDEMQFQLEGTDYTSFSLEEYGIPNPGGSTVIANNTWLEANPELAKGLTAAFREGYEGATDDPAAATEALAAQFPDLTDIDKFTEVWAAMDPYANEDGPQGTFSIDKAKAYADWAVANGTVADAQGNVLESFDPTPFITNEYLPD